MFGRTKKTKKPEDYVSGYEYAIFLLGLRARTEGEIRKKMIDRGFVPEIITKVIKELFQRRYLDDTSLAVSLVENFKKYKPYGFRKVQIKMMEKKIAQDVIARVLSDHFTLEDEFVVARRVVKNLDPKKITDIKARQKLMRSLVSKGFRGETINKLLS